MSHRLILIVRLINLLHGVIILVCLLLLTVFKLGLSAIPGICAVLSIDGAASRLLVIHDGVGLLGSSVLSHLLLAVFGSLSLCLVHWFNLVPGLLALLVEYPPQIVFERRVLRHHRSFATRLIVMVVLSAIFYEVTVLSGYCGCDVRLRRFTHRLALIFLIASESMLLNWVFLA